MTDGDENYRGGDDDDAIDGDYNDKKKGCRHSINNSIWVNIKCFDIRDE